MPPKAQPCAVLPEPSLRQLLFGTDEPVARTESFSVGPFQMRLRGTRLGPISHGGREVWHGVDFLYRDPDWGTPAPIVDDIEQQSDGGRLHLRLRGHIAAAERIDFDISIRAGVGMLRYEVTASASADLATNRMGLVLMHPLSVCGGPVAVEHVDGRVSDSTFPVLVAPWPPFMMVRAIRHAYVGGAWAACRFDGDDFELEDQRNNVDASFKTYSRSNMMPRPYLLRAGAVLRQAIELRIEALPPGMPAVSAVPVRLSIGPVAGMLPAIGTSIASGDLCTDDAIARALRALSPALLHLVLEAPGELTDATPLGSMLAASEGSALRLDVLGVTPQDADAELGLLASRLRDAGAWPASVAVFPSSPVVLEAARRAFAMVPVGGGTPYFFTQLNRIEDLGPVDFLAFSTAAVVHGADDEDIMAGLHSLPSMLATLRARYGSLPVHVGPSGIAARRSPLGAQPASDGTRRLAMARRDPRTGGLYGAAWTLGYIAQLAHAGAAGISLHSLRGDAALLRPEGRVPAFELLCLLTAPARWRRVTVSEPSALAAIVLERSDGRETLLANLTDHEIEVALEDLATTRPVLVMDSASLLRREQDAQASPWRTVVPVDGLLPVLRLPPYAIART